MCAPPSRSLPPPLRKTCRWLRHASNGEDQTRRKPACRLVPVLVALGHDLDTVHAERLTGRADAELWNAAEARPRFVVRARLGLVQDRRCQRLGGVPGGR